MPAALKTRRETPAPIKLVTKEQLRAAVLPPPPASGPVDPPVVTRRARRGAALKAAEEEVQRLSDVCTQQAAYIRDYKELAEVWEKTAHEAKHAAEALEQQRLENISDLTKSEAGRTAAENALIIFHQQLEAMHMNMLAFMTQWGINPEDHNLVWQRTQRQRRIARDKANGPWLEQAGAPRRKED